MKPRFGMDLHGVLDSRPEFKPGLRFLVQAGCEVHIITGALRELAHRQLAEAGYKKGVHFTHFMSVAEYVIRNKLARVTYDERGNPWMNGRIWNKVKGEYCKKKRIWLHLDDTAEYGKHFRKTIFALIPSKKRKKRKP